MPKYNNQRGVYITGSTKRYIEFLESVQPPTKKYFVKIEHNNTVFYLDKSGKPCDFFHAMAMSEDRANELCKTLRMKGFSAYVFSTSKNVSNI